MLINHSFLVCLLTILANFIMHAIRITLKISTKKLGGKDCLLIESYLFDFLFCFVWKASENSLFMFKSVCLYYACTNKISQLISKHWRLETWKWRHAYIIRDRWKSFSSKEKPTVLLWLFNAKLNLSWLYLCTAVLSKCCFCMGFALFSLPSSCIKIRFYGFIVYGVTLI